MARVTRRGLLRAALLLALLAGLPAAAFAAAPDAHQELVYNAEIFDGQGYGGQFYPAEESTIYVLADVPNVLVPRLTQVYWWPITHEYKADWDTLNQPVTATLEIDRLQFPPATYSLRYNGGYDSAKTSLIVGDAAAQAHAAYQKGLDDYNAASARYTQEQAAYEDLLAAWGQAVDAARAKGQPTDKIPVPKAPVQPTQPTVVVTTPATGIPFQVAPGRYQMRLRGADGQVLPGSQRTLVAFAPRRDGIAYKVIAASKYTVPDASTDPNDTIFVSGEKALYVQPTQEREYDNYYAAKLVNSQDRAAQDRRGVWVWLPAGPYAGDTLALSVNGGPPEMRKKATYYAKQTPGGALGYDILPYDASAGAGVATFDAFMLQPQSGVLRIAAPGVAGSSREIRVVNTHAGDALLALSFLPLLGGLGWLVLRQRRTR